METDIVLTIEQKRELQSELFYKIHHYKMWLKDNERTDHEETKKKLEESEKKYQKLSDEIKVADKNTIEFFRLYIAVVKRELDKFDKQSGQNYSKNYLLIGFMLWKDFQRQILNDEVIKFQYHILTDNGIYPMDILQQHIIATESLQNDFITKPPETLRKNKRNIEKLLMFIDIEIELTSIHSYIIDEITTKKIYLTAILLQIVCPKTYPPKRYNNKKALTSAIKMLGLDENELDNEFLLSIQSSFRQFKKKFKTKYKLTDII